MPKKIHLGGRSPQIKHLSQNSLIMEMRPTEAHWVLTFIFSLDPPILIKLGSKVFLGGLPLPKWGVGEKFWRHRAVACLDCYAHRKFQIDTTPNGDAIRVYAKP